MRFLLTGLRYLAFGGAAPHSRADQAWGIRLAAGVIIRIPENLNPLQGRDRREFWDDISSPDDLIKEIKRGEEQAWQQRQKGKKESNGLSESNDLPEKERLGVVMAAASNFMLGEMGVEVRDWSP